MSSFHVRSYLHDPVRLLECFGGRWWYKCLFQRLYGSAKSMGAWVSLWVTQLPEVGAISGSLGDTRALPRGSTISQLYCVDPARWREVILENRVP